MARIVRGGQGDEVARVYVAKMAGKETRVARIVRVDREQARSQGLGQGKGPGNEVGQGSLLAKVAGMARVGKVARMGRVAVVERVAEWKGSKG